MFKIYSTFWFVQYVLFIISFSCSFFNHWFVLFFLKYLYELARMHTHTHIYCYTYTAIFFFFFCSHRFVFFFYLLNIYMSWHIYCYTNTTNFTVFSQLLMCQFLISQNKIIKYEIVTNHI